MQDGLKTKLLCLKCEGLLSSFETKFANVVFYPSLRGSETINYDDNLLKFCVSISWRVLTYCRLQGLKGEYTAKQLALILEAEKTWRSFLLGESEHPCEFCQQLVILGGIEETSFSGWPTNINRFLAGHVTFDIVGSNNNVMTYSKLGKFNIFGIIQNGQNAWVGTQIKAKKGVLIKGKKTLPIGVIGLLSAKARHAQNSSNTMSPKQQNIVAAEIEKNSNFTETEQFQAMAADARLFGTSAIIKA